MNDENVLPIRGARTPPPFTWEGARAGAIGILPLVPTVVMYGVAVGVLAAAAGMDLRLDHPDRPAEGACGSLRLVGARDEAAIADRRAILPQQRLGLVFVDVHHGPPISLAALYAATRTAFKGIPPSGTE